MTKHIETQSDLLDFYARQTDVTNPGDYGTLYDNCPSDISTLCDLLHNVLIHMWWIHEDTYGFTLQHLKDSGRDVLTEIGLRTAFNRLAHIQDLESSPLATPRQPKLRSVGNCRDFSVMLVSMLRHQGIPARARTGVARYFYPDGSKLEDHWICEFWNATEHRWQQVDAQIDQVMRQTLRCTFDVTDLPETQFLNGWQCYQEVAEARIEPERIGFGPDCYGLAYARYKLFGDLAFVTGDELLPWAGWGIGAMNVRSESGDQELIQTMVDLCRNIDSPPMLNEALKLFATHPRLKRPENYDPGPFLEAWL